MAFPRRLGMVTSGAVLALLLALMGTAAPPVGGMQESEDTFALGIVAANCEREPTAFPFQGGDCVPAEGAVIVVTTSNGELVGTCVAEATEPEAVVAGCAIPVPYGSALVVTEDVATIPPGYAPTSNPQPFEVPATPPDGVFGGPVFLNLPNGVADDATDDAGATCDTTDADFADASAADSTMFRGNAARTGEQPGPGPAGVPLPLADFDGQDYQGANDLPSGPLSAPVVADGVLYVGGFRAEHTGDFGSTEDYYSLYAFDAKTGAYLWHFGNFDADGAVYSTPAVAGGVVYFGTEAGTIYAVDASTHRQRWRYDAGSAVRSSVAVANGVVYAGTTGGWIVALDAETADPLWTVRLGEWALTGPAVAGGGVYVGAADGALFGVDAATGQPRWRFQAADAVIYTPAVAGDAVYAAAGGYTLHAVDAATGTERWTSGVAVGSSAMIDAASVGSPAVSGGVVIAANDGYLAAFDARTGRECWNRLTDGSGLASPSVADGVVYAGSVAGILYAFDASDGTEGWRYTIRIGQGEWLTSPPLVAGGVVYFANAGGRISAIAGSEPQ